MYQIELICVTGQHGRTVVLLNAFTLYKYIWNKKKKKKEVMITFSEFGWEQTLFSIKLNTIAADVWLFVPQGNYSDDIIKMITSQITGILIVCSTVCSGANQRKHGSSISWAFVREIHQWPVDCPHKGPVTWKMFPFDDVIMVAVTVLIVFDEARHEVPAPSQGQEITPNTNAFLYYLKWILQEKGLIQDNICELYIRIIYVSYTSA